MKTISYFDPVYIRYMLDGFMILDTKLNDFVFNDSYFSLINSSGHNDVDVIYGMLDWIR